MIKLYWLFRKMFSEIIDAPFSLEFDNHECSIKWNGRKPPGPGWFIKKSDMTSNKNNTVQKHKFKNRYHILSASTRFCSTWSIASLSQNYHKKCRKMNSELRKIHNRRKIKLAMLLFKEMKIISVYCQSVCRFRWVFQT